jgi:GNAT superfamily N-acetyltransferase
MLPDKNLFVRDATEGDLDALMRIKPTLDVHRDRLRDAHGPGFRYLVLVLEQRVIGFACLVFVRPAYWSDGKSTGHLPTVIDLILDTPLRSRGYGSFFLQKLEELAAEAGSQQLYIWVNPVTNPRAHAFYLRLHYRPLQQQPYRFHWEFVDSSGDLHAGDEWRLDLVKHL